MKILSMFRERLRRNPAGGESRPGAAQRLPSYPEVDRARQGELNEAGLPPTMEELHRKARGGRKPSRGDE
jgi:hypothetical protein